MAAGQSLIIKGQSRLAFTSVLLFLSLFLSFVVHDRHLHTAERANKYNLMDTFFSLQPPGGFVILVKKTAQSTPGLDGIFTNALPAHDKKKEGI